MEQTKTCLRCGQQTDVGTQICPRCGSSEFTQPVPAEAAAVNRGNDPYQPNAAPQNNNAGYAAPGTPGVQPPNGYTQPQPPMGYAPQPNGYNAQTPPPYAAAPNMTEKPLGMKWFKFCIYFLLFVGALSNIVSGVQYLIGDIYSTPDGRITAEMVYEAYPILRTADIIYGICAFAMAAFQIYTRFQLSKFKSRGPICLYISYGVGAALSVIYVCVVSLIIGKSAFDVGAFASIATSVAMVFVNMVYFNKRKAMFVN